MLKKVSGRQFALSLLIVVVFGYSFGKDLALKENKKDGIHADVISGNDEVGGWNMDQYRERYNWFCILS